MLNAGQEVYYFTCEKIVSKGALLLSKDNGYHWDIRDIKTDETIRDVPYIYISKNEQGLME
ncbi:hypothetical protein L8C07_05530 [Paenibacillus sp. CMAA1739]|uniref:hypothetical protein n=1 Tax=Paenibacillus ottowii TaxID=2315729 RepID=UPI002DBF3C02|nr:hypothetical protein [Paenibacillus sp. CMAA1739]MEC4565399.1 hypothetical protein [Paenibacillus sp. CMAA1739]